MRYWPDGPLVDSAWLRAHRGTREIAVLDCRFELADPGAGERVFRAGHIPGARYLHLERDLSGPVGTHGGRHPLPSPEAFAAAMERNGVGDDTMVVAYDQDGSMAPRAWWLLRYMGHDAAAVLDGGIEAWREAGGELETAIGAAPARRFTPRPRAGWTVDLAGVRALGPETVILDARAGERYRGEIEPIDPRAGHVPGARSSPYRDGLDPRGRWRDEGEQARRFDRLAPHGAPVVAYCGSGVTACGDLLALEIAGRPGGRLYPGSFSDWASYPDLPVATGQDP